jgi:predicted NBD/HSP70 family sugar kinase
MSPMATPLFLPVPRFIPPLDPSFRPASLANRAFRAQVEQSDGGIPLLIALERGQGEVSRYETRIFSPGHPQASANLMYVERLLKFLLWQRGGWKVWVGGSPAIAEHLREIYSPDGRRCFDHDFMGRQVYEQEFTVLSCALEDVPASRESGKRLGRHLDGCRVGFDLGASDRKASAVMDGKVIFSEEIVWEPRKHSDPSYHYHEIKAALLSAAAHLPRLDAIGGSSAGILIDNRPMVASLFRAVPADRYAEVRNLFLRLRAEFGVPLEVINDGDITALAGAMSLDDTAVLGIAMGSSEAAGYVNPAGQILPWLSELAFAPVDYSPTAPADEWSGDQGVGAQYFSQQCVFRLAPRAGIEIPAAISDAERLLFVQNLLEAGHPGAAQIWESMGYFLGYALAHYAEFYDVRHILILGRCTSGRGGNLILDNAARVLTHEFPDLAGRLQVQLPDEKSRRVGQSIAAASLPERAR